MLELPAACYMYGEYLYDIPALQSLQAAEDSLWGNKTAV